MFNLHFLFIFVIFIFCNKCELHQRPTDYQPSSEETVKVPLYSTSIRHTVIQHHCYPNQAIIISQSIFLTSSLFDRPASPLHYDGPQKLNGSVSAAVFVLDQLVFVIDGQVLLYSINTGTWSSAQGVTSAVSSVSSVQCCLSTEPTCGGYSSTVVAYQLGGAIKDQNVFLSTNGGSDFRVFTMAESSKRQFIGGVYTSPTLSSIVSMVTDERNMFSFRYDAELQLQSDWYQLKDPLHDIRVVQPAGMRGRFIVWSPHMLLYSPNQEARDLIRFTKIGNEEIILPLTGVTVLQVITDKHAGVAVYTSDGSLFYGRLGRDASMTKLPTVADPFKDILVFNDNGDLMLLSKYDDLEMTDMLFKRVKIDVNVELARADPPSESCPCSHQEQLVFHIKPLCAVKHTYTLGMAEHFASDFKDQLVYIDKGRSVVLHAVYTTSFQSDLFPMVTVSDARLLQTRMDVKNDGVSTSGNRKFRLEIWISETDRDESSNQNRSRDMERLSTVTIELAGMNLACNHLKPLRLYIKTGCSPQRHIRIVSNYSACDIGVINIETLHNNFSYSILRWKYEPEHRYRDVISDQNRIVYNATRYHCPLQIIEDFDWTPVLHLYEDDEFVEIMPAEFVMFEVNGIHSFKYSYTAEGGKCLSQPQSWSTMMAKQSQPDPHTAWNRTNYRSCRDKNGPPVSNPKAPYQVLKHGSGNMLFFGYDTIYVFEAIVVDPSYSYCHLNTFFSVWADGLIYPGILPSYYTMYISLAVFIVWLCGYYLLCVRRRR